MRRKISGTCILIMLMISSATSQQPPNASIEGTVVDIETGQPIPGARLVLTRPAAVPAGLMPPPILVTITNREGRFEFAALDAGSYRIAVAAEGYVRQEFSQMPLNLSAGQTLKDVLLRLTSTGTVAGVIRTNSGKPAAGVQIQLVSPRYGPGGERRLVAAGAAKTNDRGEYRLYWITPGRYYVVAGSLDALESSFQSVESGGLGGSPNEYQSTGYGVTFYPGVSDPFDAVFVTVRSGVELKLDLVVAREQYRVRGRVVDARTGQWPAGAQVTIQGRRLLEGAAGSVLRTIPIYNATDGTFEVRDVPSGLYYLSATLPRANATGAAGSGPVRVAVSASDVNGVLMTVAPYVSIPGRITIEGQGFPAAALNRSRVSLNLSAGGRRLTETSYGAIGGLPTPSPDGTFTLNNVMAGEYRLSLLLQPGYYIKEARYNGSDVLNGPLLVSSSTPGTLDIVLSPKVGRISGVLVDAKQKPDRSVQIVLIPAEQRDRSDLYRTASTDDSGRFALTDVAPGDYKLFAWEALDPYAYFDPKILEPFEQQGKPVHVAESTTANVEVEIIPARSTR